MKVVWKPEWPAGQVGLAAAVCGPRGCSGLLETRAIALFLQSRGVRADQRQLEPWTSARQLVDPIPPAQLESIANFLDRNGLPPRRPRPF